MKNILISALFLTLFSTVSQAGDLAPNALTATQPAISWTGFYAGANVGYGSGSIATTDNSMTTDGQLVGLPRGFFNPVRTFSGADSTSDVNGWLGGAQLGYNLQISNFVLGIEADLQDVDFRSESSFLGSAAGPFYQASSSIDWFGTLRGRIGYNYFGVMPYVTAGMAYARTTANLVIQPGTQAKPIGTPFSTTDWNVNVGWAAGAGVEAMLGGTNWSLRAEYLHLDLGTRHYDLDYLGAGSAGASGTVKADIGRIGLNYRF